MPFWHHIVCVVLQHVQQTITGNLAKENDVLQMNQFAFTGKPMAEGTFLLFFISVLLRAHKNVSYSSLSLFMDARS